MRANRLKTGIRLRSRLFGKGYAESSLASGDRLNREVQELITEYGYGAVWTRPGLPIAFRSMLTLGLLAALNRPDQLRAHLDGARNLGVSRRQIVEVFIHVIVYAGAPAGLAATKLAMDAFSRWDKQTKSVRGGPRVPKKRGAKSGSSRTR